MMVKIGDSDLHAEREKRQPKQPQAESRDGHRSPSIFSAAEFVRSCVTIVAAADGSAQSK
jgi:hypothetical protein